jgi:hypothetical protein
MNNVYAKRMAKRSTALKFKRMVSIDTSVALSATVKRKLPNAVRVVKRSLIDLVASVRCADMIDADGRFTFIT